MSKTFKLLSMSAAVAAMSFLPMSAAWAGRYHHGYYRHYHHGYGGAAAAGIMGLAAGAIIGGAIAESRQPRVYYGPLRPWTPAWYNWCESSYRSFNPRTGTFRGYDGRDHFCVAR